MNAPTQQVLSLLAQHDTEWRALKTEHCNVLIEGSVGETRAVLVLLAPHLPGPIVRTSSRAPLQLPRTGVGALIVENIASLSEKDQGRLLAWVADEGRSTQIISTTEESLFPSLATRRFDHRLYYRLNVILLRLLPTDEPPPRDRNSKDEIVGVS